MIDYEDIEPGYYLAKYYVKYTTIYDDEIHISEWEEPDLVRVVIKTYGKNKMCDKIDWRVEVFGSDDPFYVKEFIFIKRIDIDELE